MLFVFFICIGFKVNKVYRPLSGGAFFCLLTLFKGGQRILINYFVSLQATIHEQTKKVFNNNINYYSITIMMKRKMYEKPSMKVFESKQQPQLLAGSYTASFDNYEDDNTFTW